MHLLRIVHGFDFVPMDFNGRRLGLLEEHAKTYELFFATILPHEISMRSAEIHFQK